MASLRKLSLIKNGRSNLCLHDGRKANQWTLEIRVEKDFKKLKVIHMSK